MTEAQYEIRGPFWFVLVTDSKNAPLDPPTLAIGPFIHDLLAHDRGFDQDCHGRFVHIADTVPPGTPLYGPADPIPTREGKTRP